MSEIMFLAVITICSYSNTIISERSTLKSTIYVSFVVLELYSKQKMENK